MKTRAASCCVALGFLISACDDVADPCRPQAESSDEEASASAGEPAYGGEGNDEVWTALYDAKERAETGGDAATIVKPTAGEVYPSSTAPVLTWESPLKLALGPVAPAPLRRVVPASALERALGYASAVIIPFARAHEAPVSSDAYLVEITVPERQCPVSIVTTELSHTLDEDTWSALREAAGKDLSLRITSAYLASGRVTEGPYRSADVPFQVE